MDKIRVVIVDDDLDWLKSMTNFLNGYDDLLVVGTAVDREEAVQISRTREFDVMLLDINLQGNRLDGIYAAMDILEGATTRIIMMTLLDENEIVTQSFAAGAVNFIPKINFEEIPNAIRNAMKGNFPLDPLLKEFRSLKKEVMLQVLTPSELEIFKLAEAGYQKTKKGYTQEEMAEILDKSVDTIKKQSKSICHKLKVPNLKEAIKKINTYGVVEQDELNHK